MFYVGNDFMFYIKNNLIFFIINMYIFFISNMSLVCNQIVCVSYVEDVSLFSVVID